MTTAFPALRTRRRSFLRYVLMFAMLPAAAAQGQATRALQPAGIVAVVGNWSTASDGGAVFKVDGARWSGTTQRSQAEAASRAIFGAVNDTFIANATAAQAFPVAIMRDAVEFGQGTIRVRFNLIAGASDQIAGIVFGFQPTGEYYFGRYNTKDGNVAIWRYANGTRTRVAEGHATLQLPLEAWHELSVTINGNTVTCAVIGTNLGVEHTFDAPVTGRVGLWAKRDAVSMFRDVTLTRRVPVR